MTPADHISKELSSMIEVTEETGAHAPMRGTRRTVESQVRGLYDAWQTRDEGRIRAFFSDRDDLKLWGTDRFERIVGRAEADQAFASWIATCPPWTSMEPTHRVMHVRDDLAWIADDVEGRWARGDEVGIEDFRITTIWEATNGVWLVVHANIASPH
jgi:SnoaL-like domain